MVDWHSRDEQDISANFEGKHEHTCPCGKVHKCVLMACRGVDQQECWPCKLKK